MGTHVHNTSNLQKPGITLTISSEAAWALHPSPVSCIVLDT